MKIFNAEGSVVNSIFPHIFSNAKNELFLSLNGHVHPVDPSPFSAWFIASSFSSVNMDKQAREWFEPLNPFNAPIPQNLTCPPRLYQMLAYGRMRLGSCALWMDMGLGKTFLSIMVALKMYEAGRGSRFVILCPKSVFVTWLEEFAKFISPSVQAKAFLLHGASKRKRVAEARTFQGLAFLLTTYESLSSVMDDLIGSKNEIGAIFLDEASRVKNMEARRTLDCHRLVEMTGAPRYLLSGTPSTTSIEGYYSLYELLGKGSSGCETLVHFRAKYTDSKLFWILDVPFLEYDPTTGLSKQIFRPQHVFIDPNHGVEGWLARHYPPGSSQTFKDLGYVCTRNRFWSGPEPALIISGAYNKITGVKNTDEFKKVTGRVAYSLQKESVLTDLPPKTYIRRTVTMRQAQEKAYKEIAESMRTEIGSMKFSFRNLRSPFAKLVQIANGYLTGADGIITPFKEQPKLEELEILLDELENQKLLIWSSFIPQLKMIGDFLTKKKISHGTIYGETSTEKRIENVRRFREDSMRILVLNPSVGGLGLNLTAAHTEIFMSNWYAPDIRAQAEDRCHRSGQTFPVTIIDVMTEGTLEKKILTSLLSRIDLESELLKFSDLSGAA